MSSSDSKPRSEALAVLPIRTRFVLGASGVRSVALTVFCPQQGSTSSVAACERCPRHDSIDLTGDRPTLTCRAIAAMSAHEPVGSLVRSAVLCVAANVLLDSLDANENRSGVTPVVDESNRYVGAIVHGRSSSVPPPVDSARGLFRGLVTAGDAMDRVPPVNEHDDAVTAAATMTSSRARCVPVVDDRNAVVGLLDDIALLASVTRAHARAGVVKECSCGRRHSHVQWSRLPDVGRMAASCGETLELRNCPACGSTLATSEASTFTARFERVR